MIDEQELKNALHKHGVYLHNDMLQPAWEIDGEVRPARSFRVNSIQELLDYIVGNFLNFSLYSLETMQKVTQQSCAVQFGKGDY